MGVTTEELKLKITRFSEITESEIVCLLSVGYLAVEFGQNMNAETAFDLADQRTYEMKLSKKGKVLCQILNM